MQKITEHRLYEKIKSKLENMVMKRKDLEHALLLIHSDTLNIHWKFAAGVTGHDQKQIHVNNPYYIASIGKTFTSIIIARLFERGMIHFDDPISKFLPSETLKGLFVFNGNDYSNKVLVKHLLNHTSGVADFYEDKPIKGKSMKDLVIEEPQRFWRPEDTIAYTRENQSTYSIPGKRFHYSDTGYNLIGKIIEEVTNKSLHENLQIEIFHPLGMTNSYVLFYSEPIEKSPYEIADIRIGKHEVSTYKSLSIDWAGGGFVSTLEDLLLFHKALINNTLQST